MEDSIKELGYKTIINELYTNINRHIGNKLEEIIPKDYDSDDYTMCLYFILDVPKVELFDTYQTLLDDVIDIEYKYGLTICVLTYTSEDFKRYQPVRFV